MSCIDISKEQHEYKMAVEFIKGMCDGQLCKEDTILSRTKELYPLIEMEDVDTILSTSQEFLRLTPEDRVDGRETIYYLKPSWWRRMLGIPLAFHNKQKAQKIRYYTYTTYLLSTNRTYNMVIKIKKHLPLEIRDIVDADGNDIFKSAKDRNEELCYIKGNDVYCISSPSYDSYDDYDVIFLGKQCDENGVLLK